MSKGDKRRPGDSAAYRDGHERIYGDKAVECPGCGEIELRPAKAPMWECSNCKLECQF